MINNKKITVVVTARAGSQGIIGKNYKILYGKPLFLWSLISALDSKYVDNIVVSTNCENVKKITYDYTLSCDCQSYLIADPNKNIILIERPEEISGPFSKNEEALKHSCLELDKRKIYSDIVVNLQPTSPIRENNLLDKCIESYVDNNVKFGCDSLLTVNKTTPFLWSKKSDISFVPNYDIYNRPMRQDVEKNNQYLYFDNGNIYLMEREVLFRDNCRIGRKPFLYEIDKYNSLQIDTDFDFQIIEQYFNLRK